MLFQYCYNVFFNKIEPVTPEDAATACREGDGSKEEINDAQDKSGSDWPPFYSPYSTKHL